MLLAAHRGGKGGGAEERRRRKRPEALSASQDIFFRYLISRATRHTLSDALVSRQGQLSRPRLMPQPYFGACIGRGLEGIGWEAWPAGRLRQDSFAWSPSLKHKRSLADAHHRPQGERCPAERHHRAPLSPPRLCQRQAPSDSSREPCVVSESVANLVSTQAGRSQ